MNLSIEHKSCYIATTLLEYQCTMPYKLPCGVSQLIVRLPVPTGILYLAMLVHTSYAFSIAGVFGGEVGCHRTKAMFRDCILVIGILLWDPVYGLQAEYCTACGRKRKRENVERASNALTGTFSVLEPIEQLCF